jgi:two-component system, OmpR family, response regulator RegX3
LARIAIVEDDHVQAQLYHSILELAGHKVACFHEVIEFRRALCRGGFDLVVLDWMLPDESGVDVVGWLRGSAYAAVPVLMLTMRDQEHDVQTAFESGADDYLVKPANRAMLLVRVNALLRRSGLADSGTLLAHPPYAIDARRRVVTLNDEPVVLTEKEFDLAVSLFRRANLMVSRDQLLSEVWRMPAGVETRSVDTYVSRLRKRLILDGSHGWRLRTIYQHGYRLEQADVEV